MNTKIKTFICAAGVLLTAVSCQKSIEIINTEDEVKGTIDIRVNGLMGEYAQVDGTRASLVNNVRVSWEGGETVYVYDGTQCLGSLVASLEGTEDRYAILSTDGSTHTVKTPASGTTKLTLVYSPMLTVAPTASNGAISISLAEQNSTTAPFVAYATMDYTGTTITNAIVSFKFATSAIRVNCTGLKANTAITSATLSNVNTSCKLTLSGTGAPSVSGDVNGTITRIGDSYFAAGKVNSEGEAVFQIAVPTLETASKVRVLTVAQNSYKFIDKNFTTNLLNPATSVNTVCQLVGPPADALPGVFSVSDSKEVYFSKGNLRYTIKTKTWDFYLNQFNTQVTGDVEEISLFTWGFDAKKSVEPEGSGYVTGHTTTGETFSLYEDWGFQIGDGITWRTLTTEEWQYLLGSSQNRKNKYKHNVTIANSNPRCLVIVPDNWDLETYPLQTEYNRTSSPLTWDQAEAMGLVCLPPAGSRNGKTVSSNAHNGYYWSSSAYDKTSDNKDYAYYVTFGSSDSEFKTTDYSLREKGHSVRLVADVE